MSFTPDEVRAFFRSHWTVRKYKPFTIPADHLDAILFAAQRAPTDATAQMYTLIRLTDPSVREEIAALSGNPHIAAASEAFIVCADVHRLGAILASRGHEPGYFPRIAVHFGIGDAVLAGENLLIAAEMLGYQGCWIGGVLNALEEIATRLELPPAVVPFAGLTIGVPDEPRLERPRLPRDHVVHENAYRMPSAESLKAGIEGMASITARGDWAQTLARYFGRGGGMESRDLALKEFLDKRLFKRESSRI